MTVGNTDLNIREESWRYRFKNLWYGGQEMLMESQAHDPHAGSTGSTLASQGPLSICGSGPQE